MVVIDKFECFYLMLLLPRQHCSASPPFGSREYHSELYTALQVLFTYVSVIPKNVRVHTGNYAVGEKQLLHVI